MRKSLLLTFLLVLTVLCPARAGVGELVNLGSLELDKDYALAGDFSDYTASFEAPKKGTLTVFATTAGALMTPYSDADCTQQINYHFSYVENGVTYDIPVEAGVTYYFYKSFCMDSGTLRLSIEDNAALTLTSSSPEAGTILSAAGSGILSFAFNKSVSVDTGLLVAGSHEYPLTVNTLGASAIIDYKTTLMDAYADGLKAGDDLTVRLTGVCAAGNAGIKFAGTGIFEMKFTAAGKPVSLLRLDNLTDNRFLSYWVKGDTSAMMTLTFDGKISSPEADPIVVRLEYGDVENENGDYYSENVPFTLDDSALSIDFSDKLRRPQDMVPSATDYGRMTLRILKVRDADGNYVYTPAKGAIGSFSYGFDYTEVTTNVISEFTPAAGASLADVDSIEVWIADYASIRHDGFLYTYTLDGQAQSQVVKDYSARPDTDYEGACVFMVPVVLDAFRGHELKDLTLSLNDPVFIDGVDHGADVRAAYSLDLTAVQHVTVGDRRATWYDLSGRRAGRPVRGLYIRNGHKVLVK